MITPLEKTPLHELLSKPILFDANIFMVGVENRSANKNASFESMKELYVLPLLESFFRYLCSRRSLQGTRC